MYKLKISQVMQASMQRVINGITKLNKMEDLVITIVKVLLKITEALEDQMTSANKLR